MLGNHWNIYFSYIKREPPSFEQEMKEKHLDETKELLAQQPRIT